MGTSVSIASLAETRAKSRWMISLPRWSHWISRTRTVSLAPPSISSSARWVFFLIISQTDSRVSEIGVAACLWP